MRDLNYWIERVSQASEDKRRDRTRAPGDRGGLRAIPYLCRGLRDKDKAKRRSASIALGELGDARAIPSLCRMLRDPVPVARRAAGETLEMIGGARAVLPLCEAIRDTDPIMRRIAVGALGKIGDRRAIEPLCQTLESDDSSLRRDAVAALGRIGDKRAVESLRRALNDNWHVSQAAAEAIGRIASANPDIELRSVLPILRYYVKHYNGNASFKFAIQRIETATKSLMNLPTPVVQPIRSEDNLPIPANPSRLAVESLPIPSGEEIPPSLGRASDAFAAAASEKFAKLRRERNRIDGRELKMKKKSRPINKANDDPSSDRERADG